MKLTYAQTEARQMLLHTCRKLNLYDPYVVISKMQAIIDVYANTINDPTMYEDMYGEY